jgi:transposase
MGDGHCGGAGGAGAGLCPDEDYGTEAGGPGTADPSPRAPGRVADHGGVADIGGGVVRELVAGAAGLIRIDEAWLAVEPLDMRAGTDTALARVVSVFGYARAHHAYLFANKRANRMKVLVHDGFGIWLCARRLHRGRFSWVTSDRGAKLSMSAEQLSALVVGLPWQQLDDLATIRVI